MFAMGPEFISDRHQSKASPFRRTEDRRGLRRLFEFLQPFEKLVLVGHGPALQGDIRSNLTQKRPLPRVCVGRFSRQTFDRTFDANLLPQMRPIKHDRRERVLDRKSTRLNSSHVSISYAVFCLKKKN